MRDFWLNDHRNEAKKNAILNHDHMMTTTIAAIFMVYNVQYIHCMKGRVYAIHMELEKMAHLIMRENIVYAAKLCLFRCSAIKMNTRGMTSHWINLEVRLFICFSSFSLFHFAKWELKFEKKILDLCSQTPITIIKQTNQDNDDFTLHLYMSCYTHHVQMRWLKYIRIRLLWLRARELYDGESEKREMMGKINDNTAQDSANQADEMKWTKKGNKTS